MRLEAGTPNPFRSAIELRYTLPRRASHRVAVYDVLGRNVAVLAEGGRAAGRYVATWDGSDEQGRRVASGIYFVRLEVDGQVDVRRVTLAR